MNILRGAEDEQEIVGYTVKHPRFEQWSAYTVIPPMSGCGMTEQSAKDFLVEYLAQLGLWVDRWVQVKDRLAEGKGPHDVPSDT